MITNQQVEHSEITLVPTPESIHDNITEGLNQVPLDWKAQQLNEIFSNNIRWTIQQTTQIFSITWRRSNNKHYEKYRNFT